MKMAEDIQIQANMEIDKKGNCVTLSVNPKIYPLDVVLSSAYIFTEDYYILVDGDPNEELIVEIRPKKEKQNLEKIGREFNNELINYANYAVQAIKNDEFRRAIINRVLLTNSLEPIHEEHCIEEEVKPWEDETDTDEEEEKPWFDDPEGIAVPWEEKYGDKAKEK